MEAGKLGNVQDEAVKTIKDGVYNMLAELDIYETDKNVTPDSIILNEQVYIKSKDRGFFVSNYSAGESVIEGDVIGIIKNEFGKVLAEVTTPSSGIILYKVGTPPINIGETIMCIASQSD